MQAYIFYNTNYDKIGLSNIDQAEEDAYKFKFLVMKFLKVKS